MSDAVVLFHQTKSLLFVFPCGIYCLLFVNASDQSPFHGARQPKGTSLEEGETESKCNSNSIQTKTRIYIYTVHSGSGNEIGKNSMSGTKHKYKMQGTYPYP
jgi:hypothetical protein